jgi:hypothetical protein
LVLLRRSRYSVLMKEKTQACRRYRQFDHTGRTVIENGGSSFRIYMLLRQKNQVSMQKQTVMSIDLNHLSYVV